MTRKRKLAYAALLINTLVWGAAAPIVKPALSFITPEHFLFYRFLIASVISLPFVLILIRNAKLKFKDVVSIILLELVGTTLILLLTYHALSLTSALDASLIYATAPVFVTLAGIIFLHEHETKTEWKGLFVALAGTMFITVGPLLTMGGSVTSGSFKGNALMLLQNIVWAGYLIIAKRVYRKLSLLLVTGISFWVGLASFFLLSSPSGNPLATILTDLAIPQVFFAVLYMAIFGSIIGATTYLFGQNLIEVSEASVFTYLQPLVALPLSVLWLLEPLSWMTVLGTALITVGVFLAEFKRK